MFCFKKKVISLASFFLMLLISEAGIAEEKLTNSYVGTEECLLCHEEVQAKYEKSFHGSLLTFNARNKQEAKGCESCHGEGGLHSEAYDDPDYTGPSLIESFVSGQGDAKQSNELCLSCHSADKTNHWKGSQHEMADLQCSSCHNEHSPKPISTQEKCESCHVEQRAKLHRSSHLPLREGSMQCMDCHDPHNSINPSSLKQASVNETCNTCHAEKRGPLLWQHSPVAENCSNCHDPHGSINDALLTMRTNFLCQSCHSNAFHSSKAYDEKNISKPNKHLVGRSCVNCHSQIHGSNHPSGALFMR